MQYIYVAESEDAEKGHHIISVLHEISTEELEELNSCFSICALYHSIAQIKDIVIGNGIEFKEWMSPDNLQSHFDSGFTSRKLILNSNRLVLNYASSLKTFLDMEERILKKYKPDSIEQFHNLQHTFYDRNIEYRFWANFRNYIVHCDFPYTEFHAIIGKPCEVKCRKTHLLEFTNWKHSKTDIEQMHDVIGLDQMVDKMSGLIYAFYIDFFAYFGQQIVNSINKYDAFCKKYEVKIPIIVKTPAPHDIANARLQPLPVKELAMIFEELKHHPKVVLNFKSNLP